VFFKPDLFCRVSLFSLDFGKLAQRMFFAGDAKEQHGESNRDYAVADEKSHDALAQLSASGVARKTKAQR
jgi:hypothetical protein